MNFLDVKNGITLQASITLETIVCCNCGVPFAIPSRLRKEYQDYKTTFYCPNGHAQSYSKSRVAILQQQLDAKERELREKERQLTISADKNLQLKKDLEKKDRKLKRVKNGVCPCCNRSFQNLQNHMKSKHPEFSSEKV